MDTYVGTKCVGLACGTHNCSWLSALLARRTIVHLDLQKQWNIGIRYLCLTLVALHSNIIDFRMVDDNHDEWDERTRERGRQAQEEEDEVVERHDSQGAKRARIPTWNKDLLMPLDDSPLPPIPPLTFLTMSTRRESGIQWLHGFSFSVLVDSVICGSKSCRQFIFKTRSHEKNCLNESCINFRQFHSFFYFCRICKDNIWKKMSKRAEAIRYSSKFLKLTPIFSKWSITVPKH